MRSNFANKLKWPFSVVQHSHFPNQIIKKLEMWADAQRDGRPAEYRWRRL